MLKKALEDRIAALGRSGWLELIADLDSLTETEIEQHGKRFVVRSAPRCDAGLALPTAFLGAFGCLLEAVGLAVRLR